MVTGPSNIFDSRVRWKSPHLGGAHNSSRFQIGHRHRFGTVDNDVEVSHHTETTVAFLLRLTFAFRFLYDISDRSLHQSIFVFFDRFPI